VCVDRGIKTLLPIGVVNSPDVYSKAILTLFYVYFKAIFSLFSKVFSSNPSFIPVLSLF